MTTFAYGVSDGAGRFYTKQYQAYGGGNWTRLQMKDGLYLQNGPNGPRKATVWRTFAGAEKKMKELAAWVDAPESMRVTEVRPNDDAIYVALVEMCSVETYKVLQQVLVALQVAARAIPLNTTVPHPSTAPIVNALNAVQEELNRIDSRVKI